MTDKLVEALEPCPFCGSAELGLMRPSDVRGLVHSHDWFIRCYGCHVETAEYQTKVEAIAAWNRRALASRPDAGAEENAKLKGMDEAADFCIRTLAKAINVDDWQQADGSETWDGDVAGTIYNVLKAGRVYDEEDGRIARLEDAQAPAAVAGEGLGKPDEWAEKIRELEQWTASSFLAGEKVADDGAERAELYSFLCGLKGWLMAAEEAAALSTPLRQPAGDALREACPQPTIGDETYYSKGKDAPWYEALSDAEFAREITRAAQDLNDTGLGNDLDKWMPFQAMMSIAGDRLQRQTSALLYIRSELAIFAACCAVSNKVNDTFVGTEAKVKEWVAYINRALASAKSPGADGGEA